MGSISRRQLLKGTAAGAGAAALAGVSGVALADEAGGQAAAPVFDAPDLFAESRVVWQDIPADEIAETYDYDFVVVGAGSAGTTAAMAAGAKGAGTVALLQNAYACISQGQNGSGIVLSESDNLGLARYKQSWNESCFYCSDQFLVDNFINYSGEAVQFIIDLTTKAGWEPEIKDSVREYEDGHKATIRQATYGPKPYSYAEACNAMVTFAEENNVTVYYGMPGVKLVQDADGRVTGVIGKSADDDKYYQFNAAKGVLLATGCYANNQAMLGRYCTDAQGFDAKVSGHFGDGHLMGLLAGGVIPNTCHTKMMHDNDNPMQSVPFLAVNDNGERFMNEDVSNNLTNNLLKVQPNKGWWSSIFDANYYDQVTSWEKRAITEEDMLAYMPGTEQNLAKGVYAKECHAFKADTLEELAEQLGIPADNLVATVARYNELVELGEDLDFGKQTKYLAPIDTPPFWGVHRHQRISAILSGLNVNKYMQVLDADGAVIPGLYAAGNVAGRIEGIPDWLTSVASGASIGNAFTGGYVTALHVCGIIGD